MAPPLGQRKGENDTKTDRTRRRNVWNIKFTDRYSFKQWSSPALSLVLKTQSWSFLGASATQSHVNWCDLELQCAQEVYNE